jgi:SAM-dependent methyltransferase
MSKAGPLINLDQWETGWSATRQQPWQPLESNPTYAQQLWINYLLDVIPERASILEIGCAASKTLPFLARRKNAEVWGIDFSPSGIELAQQGLNAEGVQGRLILGDALQDNELPQNHFDVVLSMGVIEHFLPPNNIATLARFATYAVQDGLIITEIPNMAGIIGLLTWLFDRPLYHQHVALNAPALDKLHEQVGLSPLNAACYLGSFSIYTLNHDRLKERLPGWFHWGLLKSGAAFQRLYRYLAPGRENHWLSPTIVGAYRKK